MRKNLTWPAAALTAALLAFGVFIMMNFFKENYDYKVYESQNGLKVFSMKDDSLPFIKYDAYFHQAGSDYSFEGKSGLASLTAYLLDQGAGGLTSEQIQEELNQLGTELEIALGRQILRISLSGLSRHKKKLFDLFKKIIISPHFKEKELRILKEQFLTRRKSFLDQPSFIADLFVRGALFEGRAGEPSDGTLLSLAQINLEDIKSFYQSQYKEGNPVFSLTGKFDKAFEKEFQKFAAQNFNYQEKTVQNPVDPAYKKPRLRLLTKEGLVQSEVRLAYLLFPFPKNDFKTVLSIRLANSILGGGNMSSRLFNELREKRGLTYSVYSSVILSWNYGFFDISGATKNSSVREFIEQILLNLKRIKKEGVSLEELNIAKNQLKMWYLKNMENPEDFLYRWIYYTEYLGLNPKELSRYLSLLESLSLEEVNAVFDKFVLSDGADRLKSLKNSKQTNDKAYLQILIYGDPSIQSQLEGIEGLPSLEVTSFEDYFKQELSFQTDPQTNSK